MASAGVAIQTHLEQQQRQPLAKHACALCASRKVGCDKQLPACTNCVKHGAECRYEDVKPAQRRKRRIDNELEDRIHSLETLLRQHGIDPGTGTGAEPSKTVKWSTNGESITDHELRSGLPHIMPRFKAATTDTDGTLKLPLDGPTWLSFMEKSTPKTDSNLSMSAGLSPATTNLVLMHPEPRHILRLWQIFTERCNPIIKILHAPTVQQRILDISWNLESCSQPFQAVLFSIYLVAVVALEPNECMQHFGEAKTDLLKRYKTAAWQALMAADLFHTRDMEVLQAFVLFTLSDSRSDTSTTLSALSIRIALKMGLGKDSSPSVSLFEEEMRIRLWWQITTQDVLARHYFVGRDGTNADGLIISTIRLPLNVNDAELHPDMVKLPEESPRATEMVYVLMRYEGGAFGQRVRTQYASAGTAFNPFDEMKKLFWEKYIRFCDPQIPLHRAATSMFRYAQAGIAYRVACCKTTDSEESQDKLLEMAVEVMNADRASRDNPYSDQLLWKVSPVDLDAAVHILSKLRNRNSGDLVTRAWDAIVHFWDEHIDGDWEGESGSKTSFFARLADLTLEAWQLRLKALNGGHEDITPVCIRRLKEIRHVGGGENGVGSLKPPSIEALPALDLSNLEDFPPDLFGYGGDILYDFGFWNDVPQMPV